MKSVRRRVRRLPVDLADDAVVAGSNGPREQIVIEPARMAAPARRRRDHDPVDIDKAWIAAAKPQEVRAVIFGALSKASRKASTVPIRRAAKARPTRRCSRAGSSQDNSRACSLLSASRIWPSDAPGEISAEVTGCNSGSLMRSGAGRRAVLRSPNRRYIRALRAATARRQTHALRRCGPRSRGRAESSHPGRGH